MLANRMSGAFLSAEGKRDGGLLVPAFAEEDGGLLVPCAEDDLLMSEQFVRSLRRHMQ